MWTLFTIVLYFVQLLAVQGHAVLRREDERPYAAVEVNNIRGRQPTSAASVASYICGYQGGDEFLPWPCDIASYSCMVEPIQKVVGCCESTYCGAFRTACFGPQDTCDDACQSNGQNLICSTDAPICATYSYANQVTEVRCETEIPSQPSIAYTFSGFSEQIGLPRYVAGYATNSLADGFIFSSVSTDTQTPTAAPSSTPTTSGPTSTSRSAASTPTTSSPVPSPAPTSATNAGAIAGGVVGGLAVIAILVGLAIYFHCRHRSSPRANGNTQGAYLSPLQDGKNVQNFAPSAYNPPGVSPLSELPAKSH